MRRTTIALVAVTALLAACGQPAETPATEAAEPAAAAPEMPADAPPQEEVDPTLAAAPAREPTSCLEEVGPAASARLVERCIMVSPATRPPCNAANPCAMIQDEIDRACEMFPADASRPAECGA